MGTADGLWRGPLCGPAARSCGGCRWCERYDEGAGVLYDPHSEVVEPLRSTLRRLVGVCAPPGQPPCNVMLDSPCSLCGGDGWEGGEPWR